MNRAATTTIKDAATSSAIPAPRPLPNDSSVKSVGLICNPNSGRNRKHLAAIERLAARCDNIHYVPTATPYDIPDALAQLADANIDVLAINGGDGTVAHVLTHLLRDPQFTAFPALVLLPGGTTNMNVGDVGVRGKLLAAMESLVEWSQGNRPTEGIVTRPILEVIPGDAAPPLYGMIFGTGAIIQAIEYWHASVKRSGFRDEFSSGLAMLRTVWGLLRRDPRFSQPVHVELTLENGERLQQDVMLMAVSSMRRVFLNFTPFWGDEDSALHMTLIRDGARRFLFALPAVMRGRPNRLLTAEAGYRSHNVNRVSIAMTGAFTMDGDIYRVERENGPVRISHFVDMPFVRF